MFDECPDNLPPALSLCLFGSFELRLHGAALPDTCPRKGRCLIALLTLRGDSGSERDELARKLWPAAEDLETARHDLRQMLTRLRDALGAEAYRLRSAAGERVLRLDLTGAEVDVIAFDRAIRHGDPASLEQAVDLYRGPLLEGYPDELFGKERAARRQDYLKALTRLAADALSRGERVTASRFLHLVVIAEPEEQRVVCGLMEALLDRGKNEEARWVYTEFRSHLRRVRKGAERRPETNNQQPATSNQPLDDPPESGPLPSDSPFYVARPTDDRFLAAIARRDDLIRVKGARQMGKSSLLARGLKQAREAGDRVVLIDGRRLNAADLEDPETFYVRLGARLAEQLDLETYLDDVWSRRLGPNDNFERYLRRDVLGAIDAPLLLAMDAVDRLEACPFRGEVFGLVRSLCEERRLSPADPVGHLTLVMAYATEPRLPSVDQSPFNIGTEVLLGDFDFDQVAELNHRYGSPLRNTEEIDRALGLVDGHPYLVHRGLREMADTGSDFDTFAAAADGDESVFRGHLRDVLGMLLGTSAWADAVREVLQGRSCRDAAAFVQLRDAGVLVGPSPREARIRCPLYASYFGRHLL